MTRAAKVNLHSHPEARMFRTALGNGAKDGPNFAGYHRRVLGCGSDCMQVAVVDCRNGYVYVCSGKV